MQCQFTASSFIKLHILIVGISLLYSCKHELFCADCFKKSPVANAGADQVITLPTNVVTLDESNSSSSNGMITSFTWRRISGPFSFSLNSPNSALSFVDSLKKGIYEFELKVTDNAGLSDQDTVIIIVKDTSQQNQEDSIDVIFYWPEPTGTVNFNTNGFSSLWMEWDDNAGNYLKLVTIKLDSLSDYLAGVWCQNCPADCNAPHYAKLFGDKNIVTFHLPTGIYHWSAETTPNVFPVSPSYNPGVTTAFFNYFNTIHKVNGTITVIVDNVCTIQKIVFD